MAIFKIVEKRGSSRNRGRYKQSRILIETGVQTSTPQIIGLYWLGAVTKEALDRLREADAIVVDEIVAAGLYRETSQAFAVLLPVRSVGVMGDARTYENTVVVRSVSTIDFMTAEWSRLPYDVLARISSRIVNEVSGVNRVVYDISSKPPATIEWE